MGENSAQIEAVESRRVNVKADGVDKVVVEIECPIGKQAAARILGISTDTLDQWTARYGIPHFKYDVSGNRGKVLYLASDLLRWRKQFRVGGRDFEKEVEEMLSEARE